MKLSGIGNYGELKVERRLRLFINKEDVILENLLLPDGSGTTEIDKVIISKKGILCVESKFWGGYISGGDTGDWTQTTYYDGVKKQRKLHNPVIQNQGHIKALDKIFNADYPIFNVVFLVGFTKCSVKSDYVFDAKRFAEFYKNLEDVLSNDDISYIVAVLQKYVATKEELEKHADAINALNK